MRTVVQIILILALCAPAVHADPAGIRAAYSKYRKAVESGSWSKILQSMSKAYRIKNSREPNKDTMTHYKQSLVERPKFSRVKVKGDRATAFMTGVTTKHWPGKPFKAHGDVELIKQDGKWLFTKIPVVGMSLITDKNKKKKK